MTLFRKCSSLFLTLAMAISLFSGLTAWAAEDVTFDPSFDEAVHTVVAATDSKLTVLGRTQLYEGNPAFSGGAAGLLVAFTGTELWLDIAGGNGQLDLAVLVDETTPDNARRVKTENGTGWLCVATGLANGDHTVKVVQRGTGGWFSVSSVATDGTFREAPEKSLTVEVYGDSITEGCALFEGFYSDTYASYGGLLGDLIDADTRVASISGGGIVTNEQGQCSFAATGNPYNFYNTFNVANSSLGEYVRSAPDAIVINVGTNDNNHINSDPNNFSMDDFIRTYLDWLTEIHEEFPDTKVVCLLGSIRDDRPGIDVMMERLPADVVAKANENAGETFAYFVEQVNCNAYKELGRAWDQLHPDYKTQQYYALQLAHELNGILDLGLTLEEMPTLTPNYIFNADDLAQANGVNYTSSSDYDNAKSAAAAFDGDTSTYWQAKTEETNTTDGAWVAVELDKEYTLTQAVFDWNTIYPAGETLVEVSTDGTTWTTAAAFMVDSTTSDVTTVALPSVTAKYVRVHMFGTSNNKNYWPELLTFSVYGETAPVAEPLTPEQIAEMENEASYADYFYDGFCLNYIVMDVANRFTDWENYSPTTDVAIEEVETYINEHHLVPDSWWTTLREDLGYDQESGVYHIPYAGGFGGMMAEREYVGYTDNGDGSVSFCFITVNYEFLDDLVDNPNDYYNEALGYAEYNGNIYEGGPDGFYRILGYEDSGLVHTLDYAYGCPRFLSTDDYTLSFDRGDTNTDGTVDAADLTVLACTVGGISEVSGVEATLCCDVNSDGQVTATDLTALARDVAGIE